MCTSSRGGRNSLETESVSLVIVSQATPLFEGRQVARFGHPRLPGNYGSWGDRSLERPEQSDLAWLVDAQILNGAAAKISDGSGRLQAKTKVRTSSSYL